MTIIPPSPIFSPVHSRRLGVSSGTNLLPEDGEACSFDCIYRECGFNAERHMKKLLPTREEVRTALEEKLRDMQANGSTPDILTFTGNGEPTAHSYFPGIMEDTFALRDKYFPKARIGILNSSTFIDRSTAFEALNEINSNIPKLDVVDEEYAHLLNRSNGKYSVEKIIEEMKELKGNCTIQATFLKGGYQGKDIDNTSDKYVPLWVGTVEEIAPRQVMIYMIDWEIPDHDLRKVIHEGLDRIVALLKKEGIPATAFY